MKSAILETYYADMTDVSELLTADQEKELAKLIEKGDSRARNKMIESNLKLALKIANQYRNSGSSFEDIVQEGNFGLIKAVDKFDWRKGHRFSTYACWWIRQAIQRHLQSQSHVKFPSGSRYLIWRINNVRKEYEEEFGFYPTNAEVAEILGETEKKVSNLRTGMQWPVNIDQPIGDEGNRTFGDTIPDDNVPEMDSVIDSDLLIEKMKQAFSSLSEREELVLRLRFGISENEEDHENFPISQKKYDKLRKK